VIGIKAYVPFTYQDETGQTPSATRTFGFGGRKAKVAARVQRFLLFAYVLRRQRRRAPFKIRST